MFAHLILPSLTPVYQDFPPPGLALKAPPGSHPLALCFISHQTPSGRPALFQLRPLFPDRTVNCRLGPFAWPVCPHPALPPPALTPTRTLSSSELPSLAGGRGWVLAQSPPGPLSTPPSHSAALESPPFLFLLGTLSLQDPSIVVTSHLCRLHAHTSGG